jgi:hypothetical protein
VSSQYLLADLWLWIPGSLLSARPGMTASMNLRLGDRRRALQKVEIAAFVGLADML